MGIKKWLMKQEWRIVQIRGIWGLFYGILLLAASYYSYIAFFAAMGALGPFVFSGVILVIFLILGYVYDRVLVLWAPRQEVNIERNPFQYVPSPKDHIFWFPLYSSMLDAIEELAESLNVDTSLVAETKEYYSQLSKLRSEKREDLDTAIDLREKFVKEHPFWSDTDEAGF